VTFRIGFRTGALEAIRALPKQDRKRIGIALRQLENNPYPPRRPTADIKKLAGTKGRADAYRMRIGPWRAIYAIAGDDVDIRIFERKGDSTYD
jgi:mRNA interferase RelE/StbE